MKNRTYTLKQLSHYSKKFEIIKFPIVLVLDNVAGPANIGSIFRLADAYNIEKIISCGNNINFNSNRLRKTSRASIEKVTFENEEDIKHTCELLLENDYFLCALEITDNSIPIEEICLRPNQKTAILIGNENFGVSPEALNLANKTYHINMFGLNSSMNVAQAANVALYEITKTLCAIK